MTLSARLHVGAPVRSTVRTLTLTVYRLGEIRDDEAIADYYAWTRTMPHDKFRDVVELEVLDESGRWIALHRLVHLTTDVGSERCTAISGYVAPEPFPTTMLRHLEWVEHEDSSGRRWVLNDALRFARERDERAS